MKSEWIDAIHAVAGWVETLTITQIVGDVATLVHLVALSVAVATVLELDCRILRSAARPLTARDASALNRGHRKILAALAILWASGLVLAWVATGGDPNVAAPKLAAKAATVVLLTVTALAMGRYGLPAIVAQTGAPLLALGWPTKLGLATLGALSSAGWVAALALGASETLASAPPAMLACVVGGAHVGALAIGWALAVARRAPLGGASAGSGVAGSRSSARAACDTATVAGPSQPSVQKPDGRDAECAPAVPEAAQPAARTGYGSGRSPRVDA